MIKDRVACVRTTTYNLPVGPHVYGKKSPPDPECAGEGKTLKLFLVIDLMYAFQ